MRLKVHKKIPLGSAEILVRKGVAKKLVEEGMRKNMPELVGKGLFLYTYCISHGCHKNILRDINARTLEAKPELLADTIIYAIEYTRGEKLLPEFLGVIFDILRHVHAPYGTIGVIGELFFEKIYRRRQEKDFFYIFTRSLLNGVADFFRFIGKYTIKVVSNVLEDERHPKLLGKIIEYVIDTENYAFIEALNDAKLKKALGNISHPYKEWFKESGYALHLHGFLNLMYDYFVEKGWLKGDNVRLDISRTDYWIWVFPPRFSVYVGDSDFKYSPTNRWVSFSFVRKNRSWVKEVEHFSETMNKLLSFLGEIMQTTDLFETLNVSVTVEGNRLVDSIVFGDIYNSDIYNDTGRREELISNFLIKLDAVQVQDIYVKLRKGLEGGEVLIDPLKVEKMLEKQDRINLVLHPKNIGDIFATIRDLKTKLILTHENEEKYSFIIKGNEKEINLYIGK